MRRSIFRAESYHWCTYVAASRAARCCWHDRALRPHNFIVPCALVDLSLGRESGSGRDICLAMGYQRYQHRALRPMLAATATATATAATAWPIAVSTVVRAAPVPLRSACAPRLTRLHRAGRRLDQTIADRS